MNDNNSIFEVTPPSLFLNDNGPSILALGFDETVVRGELARTFDSMFPDTSITYYYNPHSTNESTVAWARAVVNMVEHIVVNADTANELEVFVALGSVLQNPDKVDITWIAEEHSNKGLCKLVNSYNQKMFDSWDHFAQFVKQTLTG